MTLTRTETNLLYKFTNLICKYNHTDWSLNELARRWRVAKKTLIAFFKKLKLMGYLLEDRPHYHEVIRSLTNEAIEAVKTGAFSIKKLFGRKPIGNRSETDVAQEKIPPDTYNNINNKITSPLSPQKEGEENEIKKILNRRDQDPDFPLQPYEILRGISAFGVKIYKIAANELVRQSHTGYHPRTPMGWMMSKMKTLKELGI